MNNTYIIINQYTVYTYIYIYYKENQTLSTKHSLLTSPSDMSCNPDGMVYTEPTQEDGRGKQVLGSFGPTETMQSYGL